MRRDAALLVTLVAIALFPGAGARAGTYDVVACNEPGAGGENHSWAFEPYNVAGAAPPAASTFVVGYGPVACSPLYGVSFATPAEKRTVRVGDGASWTFRAPAGTVVARVVVRRNTAARASTDDPSTGPVENGVWSVMARTPTRVIDAETCRGASPTEPCRTGAGVFPNVAPVTYEIGEAFVRWGVECQSAPCFTGTGASGENHAGLDLQAARVTVDDPVAPVLETVADGAFVRPSEGIGVVATDSAGIRSLRALVDGVERVALAPACDYRLAAPCSARVQGSLGAVGEGRHTVTALAEDAAGNPARVDRAVVVDGTPPALDRVTVRGRTVTAVLSDPLSGVAGGTLSVRGARDAPFTELPTTVRNGRLVATVPRPLSPSKVGLRLSVADRAGNALSGVVSSMSLTTRVGARARTVRNARASVPYGRAVTVAGRLTTLDGALLANQLVAVSSQIRQTGAAEVALASVRTDARGRFSLAVPAGPSRVLRVVYAGGDGFVGRTRSVSLRVAAGATIHASSRVLRGAGSVRFSGRLRTLGTKLPPGGKIVDLQASAGGRWSTVDTTRAAGRNGTWRATARFRGTPGRYPVRLRIRREAAFGYDLGYSRAVVVTVR